MNDADFATSIFAEVEPAIPSSLPKRGFRYRRFGWSPGSPVCLANRTSWQLSKLDLALIMTTPELLADLRKALTIAEQVQRESHGSHQQSLQYLYYHAHMANVGVRLLQGNYDPPDAPWRYLIKFDRLADMLAFTALVSEEIGRSAAVWGSLCLAQGVRG